MISIKKLIILCFIFNFSFTLLANEFKKRDSSTEELNFNINDKNLSDEQIKTKDFFIKAFNYAKENGFTSIISMDIDIDDNGITKIKITSGDGNLLNTKYNYIINREFLALAKEILLMWTSIQVKNDFQRVLLLLYEVKNGNISIIRFTENYYNEIIEELKKEQLRQEAISKGDIL